MEEEESFLIYGEGEGLLGVMAPNPILPCERREIRCCSRGYVHSTIKDNRIESWKGDTGTRREGMVRKLRARRPPS